MKWCKWCTVSVLRKVKKKRCCSTARDGYRGRPTHITDSTYDLVVSCQFSKDGSKERSVFGRKIVYYPGRVRLCPGEMAAYVTPNQFDNPQLWSSLRGSLRLAAAAFRRPSWKPAKTFPFHCSRIAPVPKKKHSSVILGKNRANLTEWKKRDRSELFYLIGAVVLAVAGSGRRCRFLRRMCYVSQPNTNGIGP